MVADPLQQSLMPPMDSIEGSYGDHTAAMTFSQVDRSADELHGRLKSLTAKRQSIRNCRVQQGVDNGWLDQQTTAPRDLGVFLFQTEISWPIPSPQRKLPARLRSTAHVT